MGLLEIIAIAVHIQRNVFVDKYLRRDRNTSTTSMRKTFLNLPTFTVQMMNEKSSVFWKYLNKDRFKIWG